jgi:hypothetical protein
MGQITYGLHSFFESRGPHFVEEYGKDDRRGETKYQLEGTYDEGISENLPKTSHTKKEFEIFKPYPRALHDTKAEDKIFKSDLYPIHGAIAKDGIVDKGRQKKEHQGTVFPISGRYLSYHTISTPFGFILKNPVQL